MALFQRSLPPPHSEYFSSAALPRCWWLLRRPDHQHFRCTPATASPPRRQTPREEPGALALGCNATATLWEPPASISGSYPYVAAMTVTKTIRAGEVTAPTVAGRWRVELALTIRLAVPTALTQFGQIVMMTTDLVLIGRLGDAALAAAALAHTVLFAAFTLGMGIVAAVAPLAAQAFGARRPRMVRRALRVGLWAAVILGVPMTLVQFQGEDILVGLGQ